MSGASSWGASDLDPDVHDAAREQARKHGLTLGEWLNQAILAHEEASRAADLAPKPGPYIGPSLEDDVGGGALSGGDTRRMAEALERLAERIDTSERRQALMLTGLDRAVLGLATRVEDTEAGMRQTSTKVSGAVEEIRRKSEVLGQRVADAEITARTTAEEASDRLRALDEVRASLDRRLAETEQVARRTAEEVSQTLFEQTRDAHAELESRISEAESLSRDVASAAAKEIATAQEALERKLEDVEAAAREAAEDQIRALREEQSALAARVARAETTSEAAATDAVRELKSVQAAIGERVDRVEAETRRAAHEAIADVRRAHEVLAEKVAAVSEDRASEELLSTLQARQDELAERLNSVETVAKTAAMAATEDIRGAQQALEARLEQIEQSSRESATNLRLGAAAAINQVRAAQLDLEKRIKNVESAPGPGPGVDGERLRETFSTLEQRLEKVERSGGDRAALHILDAKITGLAASLREGRERTEQDIGSLRARIEGAPEGLFSPGGDPAIADRLNQVERTFEDAISRLATRLETAEATTKEALRRLETAPASPVDTNAVQQVLDERLEGMAASFSKLVSGLRTEFASKLQFGEGAVDLESALADVNRRVAASERRQAQTIEAISIEIRRMSEGIDRRLRTLETRNDDSAAEAVREEIGKLARTLEERIGGIESREIAGVERVGAEMGRIAERFEDRFDAVERRSAEAIEHIGEQVARMAERQAQRQEQTTRDLSDRISESEERQSARLSDTLAAVESRISALDERTQSSVSPVQKALTSFVERLQAVEDGTRGGGGFERLRPRPAEAKANAVESPLVQAPQQDLDFDEEIQSVDRDDIDTYASTIAAARGEEDSPPTEIVDLEAVLDAADVDPFDQLLPASAPPRSAGNPGSESEENDAVDWTVDGRDAPPPAQFGWDDAPEANEMESKPAPKTARTVATKPSQPDPDLDVFDLDAKSSVAPAPVGKNDYLANARRAAQAASAPSARKHAGASAERRPVEGLRGLNKVVLWSAAGALAVAIAGGAVLLNGKHSAHDTSGARPTPAPKHTPPSRLQESSLDGAAAAEGVAATAPDAAQTAETLGGGANTDSIAAAAERQRALDAAKKRTGKDAHSASDPGHTTQGPEAARNADYQQASLSTGGGLSIEQAALRGDAVAQYELGLQRLSNAQTPEGIALLRRAANQGLAMAQYHLAKLFERGEGVSPDINQARQWTERAATAGNRKAMHDLGVYYARGEGAPLDEGAAFRWFRQAADLGVADSQFNLGILYAQGRGTVSNPQEAFYWFLVAARSGDADARARALSMEQRLTPEQAQAIRTRAAEFKAKPASARANGEFGQRNWASVSAQATGAPRS